jgi:hypothetical protein
MAVTTPSEHRGNHRWMRSRSGVTRRMVHLLEADPLLAGRVPAEERQAAARVLVAPVQRIPRGTWRPDTAYRPLAYLVLDGALLRSCCVGDRCSTEILGPQDLLRPWEEADGMAAGGEWRVLESVQAAILDRRLVAAAARWPEVFDELLGRSVRRSRNLTVLRTVCAIRRLDVRLLVLLTLLAERWGRVSTQGVHVGVQLTHESIAHLAGAQRPSVSTAIARLRRRGLITTERRELVLAHELPPEVEQTLARLA